jgi:hypothetical protein
MIARHHKPLVQNALDQFPAVVLTGARQAGKTTLARDVWPHATYSSLDDPAQADRARRTPEAFLAQTDGPHIIDEIQYVPELFRHLKLAIDHDRRPGRYLITGSQAFPLMAGASESLAGRAAVLTLPTLELREVFPATSAEEADRFLWRSGYPELWQRQDLARELWMGSYVATYLERDVRQALNVGDLRDFDRLVRVAALRAGQLVSYADIARDVGISPNTAKRWLSVLAASQQVFFLEPYPRQRTKRLIKAPKIYFSDTGLLCFLLGFQGFADLQAHAMWGAVWENFVVSEVRKRLQATPGPNAMWFWRTAQGDEVDLLVESGPERFLAIECKTAERVGPEALKGISRLAAEYGPAAVVAARVACRTPSSYPLSANSDASAVSVGGLEGLGLTA